MNSKPCKKCGRSSGQRICNACRTHRNKPIPVNVPCRKCGSTTNVTSTCNGERIWCAACRKAFSKRCAINGKKRQAETDAELDALIREQQRRLPAWWAKERAFAPGDV